MMKLPKYFNLILVVFIGALLLYAVYIAYVSNSLKQTEKFEVQGTTPKVILYFAEWCGHCQQYEKSGVFNDVMQKAREDPQLNGKVTFEKREGDDPKSEADKYDIRGFPTIIGVDASGNKKEEFMGDRFSEEELIKFAKSLL
jgi:thiol-disulfide isomerase/thioredoxin